MCAPWWSWEPPASWGWVFSLATRSPAPTWAAAAPKTHEGGHSCACLGEGRVLLEGLAWLAGPWEAQVSGIGSSRLCFSPPSLSPPQGSPSRGSLPLLWGGGPASAFPWSPHLRHQLWETWCATVGWASLLSPSSGRLTHSVTRAMERGI